ncbi:unnamed protein product [Schistosoma margrebowiei]|uniref:Uncharacterized protein n=1 Tax=Schistosoma margrebowiei TaxID=48269 RepID=A0A183M696_9TREM|nr:unnamed protein product [Schistosoma margrebowiei]
MSIKHFHIITVNDMLLFTRLIPFRLITELLTIFIICFNCMTVIYIIRICIGFKGFKVGTVQIFFKITFSV